MCVMCCVSSSSLRYFLELICAEAWAAGSYMCRRYVQIDIYMYVFHRSIVIKESNRESQMAIQLLIVANVLATRGEDI